jgi:hypothetical protein
MDFEGPDRGGQDRGNLEGKVQKQAILRGQAMRNKSDGDR